MEPSKSLRIETTDNVQESKAQNGVQQDATAAVDIDMEIFEPDYTTKKIWLATRKDTYNSTGIYLPGFYQTSDIRIDKIFFRIALVIEAIAFYIILSGGLSSSDPTNKLKAIVASIGFLALDGFGAYFVHKMTGNICLQENKIQAEPDRHKINAYGIEKDKGGYYRYLGILLIISSSMFKVLGTIMFGHISSLILTIILFFLYIFVIYIHINHTGYFISNWLYQRRYIEQYNKYSQDKVKKPYSQFAGRKLMQPMISPISIFIEDGVTSKKVENHQLVFVKEHEGEFHYNLKTKGILKDAEIHTFLNVLKPEAKPGLAKNCLYHQVFNIHVGDSRATTIPNKNN